MDQDAIQFALLQCASTTGTRGSDRYAYYECPGCRLRAGRDAVEDEFVAFLTELRPKPEFLHLFKAVVLDVWNARQAEAVKAAEGLRLRAADIRRGGRSSWRRSSTSEP